MILGLDLSLTSTGWADPLSKRTGLIKPRPKKDMGLEDKVARMNWLRSELIEVLLDVLPTTVVVEGPSHGSTGGHEHERGGWWWTAVGVCMEAGATVMVATPTMIKKFATGKGNADKDVVLMQTVRRFDWFEGNNDEADALWAAAMGHHHVHGQPLDGLTYAPAALDALKTWN